MRFIFILVFQYVSYEGNINLDSITDEEERLSILTQIENFGQTPSQLLRKPHPSRNDCKYRLPSPIFTTRNIHKAVPSVIDSAMHPNINISKALAIVTGVINSNSFLLVLIDDDRTVSRFVVKHKESMAIEKLKASTEERLVIPFDITPDMFCISPDAKVLFSCGYWDNSINMKGLDIASTYEHNLYLHKDRVTCLKLTKNGKQLISGSRDTTIVVTTFHGRKYKNNSTRLLLGHTDEVKSLDASSDLDICVSCGDSGNIIIHTLSTGIQINKVKIPYYCSKIVISNAGFFVAYCFDYKKLFLFDLNGLLVTETPVPNPIKDIIISECGYYLVLLTYTGSIIFHFLLKYNLFS